MRILFNIICLLAVSNTAFPQESRITYNPDALHKIWQGTSILNDQISDIIYDGDTLKKIPANNVGYPIESWSVEHYYYWDDNQNRFLVEYNRKYCVVDSNLNIVIPLSDTIIPSTIYDTTNWTIQLNYSNHSSTFSCLFQSVESGLTTLWDNDGKRITDFKYSGLIHPNDINHVYSDSLFITYDFKKSMKQGLISSNGETIISNSYDRISRPNMVFSKNNFLLLIDMVDGVYKKHCDFFLKSSKSIALSVDDFRLEYIPYEIFLFEKNGLWGIYHPTLGVLVKPKYVSIARKSTDWFRYLDYKLTLTKKNGKEKHWDRPPELFELYPKALETLED